MGENPKFNYISIDRCPWCRSKNYKNDGINNGTQRYRCKDCRKTFTNTTKTLLANSKKSQRKWEDYVMYLTNDLTIKAAKELGNINKNTAYLWRRKFFECIHIYQSEVILRDIVWFDEIYFSVSGKEIFLRDNGNKLRGISKNKIAAVVAIDSNNNSYCKILNKGKPTSAAILNALVGHIAKGSTLIHDEFHGHEDLVKNINGKEIVSNTKDVDNLSVLQKINQLCSLIKRVVMQHVGERRENLQCYLDWACFRHKVYYMEPKTRKRFLIKVCCTTKGNHKRKLAH